MQKIKALCDGYKLLVSHTMQRRVQWAHNIASAVESIRYQTADCRVFCSSAVFDSDLVFEIKDSMLRTQGIVIVTQSVYDPTIGLDFRLLPTEDKISDARLMRDLLPAVEAYVRAAMPSAEKLSTLLDIRFHGMAQLFGMAMWKRCEVTDLEILEPPGLGGCYEGLVQYDRYIVPGAPNCI